MILHDDPSPRPILHVHLVETQLLVQLLFEPICWSGHSMNLVIYNLGTLIGSRKSEGGEGGVTDALLSFKSNNTAIKAEQIDLC